MANEPTGFMTFDWYRLRDFLSVKSGGEEIRPVEIVRNPNTLFNLWSINNGDKEIGSLSVQNFEDPRDPDYFSEYTKLKIFEPLGGGIVNAGLINLRSEALNGSVRTPIRRRDYVPRFNNGLLALTRGIDIFDRWLYVPDTQGILDSAIPSKAFVKYATKKE